MVWIMLADPFGSLALRQKQNAAPSEVPAPHLPGGAGIKSAQQAWASPSKSLIRSDPDCNSLGGRVMEQRLNRAERYRQQANRYAELARTAELDYLGEFFRKTAVRYVLMAEDLERWNKPRTARRPNHRLTSLNDRADIFLQQRPPATGSPRRRSLTAYPEW